MFSISKAIGLLALFALLSAPGHAQDVVPRLSPSLTDDTPPIPVTTLSPDLLAPQRVYTYDGTGANISAGALTPEISASVLNSAVETDTAIRDVSQAGQVSPYVEAAGRLGLSFSGDRGTAQSAFTSPGSGPGSVRPGEGAGASFSSGSLPTTGADYDQGYAAETNSALHSTWGADSTTSSRSADSVWIGKAANIGRLGLSASSASAPVGEYQPDEYQPGEYQPGGHPSGDGRPASSTESSPFDDRDRFAGQNLAFGSRTAAPRHASAPVHSRTAVEAMDSASAAGQRRSRNSNANAAGGRLSLSTETQTSPAPATDPLSARNGSLFSPAGYAFGASPFSSPGAAELSFLHPDIAAIRPISLASNAPKITRQRRLRQLTRNGELTPSLVAPGLTTPGVTNPTLLSPLLTGGAGARSQSLEGAPLSGGNPNPRR